MKTKILPDSMLSKMSPADRKAIGQKTADECQEAIETRNERDVQRQISGWLRIKGVWFAQSRTDKRTTNGSGTPDFLLTYREPVEFFPGSPDSMIHVSRPTAIEVKFGDGKLSPEQGKVRSQMVTNGWNYHVVRSLQEVIDIVKI